MRRRSAHTVQGYLSACRNPWAGGAGATQKLHGSRRREHQIPANRCQEFQAYAGDDAGTSSAVTDSNAAMTSDAVGGTSVGSSGSGAFQGKTRAEVKQELQRAQKDGTLNRLNSLYDGQ